MSNVKLLFLHGAGGTSSKWRKIKYKLRRTKGISSKLIDLPGHGQDTREVPKSIEEFAAILDKELKEDVIVIGHSMGGLIGIELAARNPRVKALVLANSHFELPVHPKLLEQLAGPVFPESFFRASYASGVDPDLLAEEKLELTFNPLKTVLADFMSCTTYKNGKEKISTLKIPVLAVYGAEDRLLPKDAEENLRNAVKSDLYVEKIAGTGHYSMLEKSKEFKEIIVAFKKSIAD